MGGHKATTSTGQKTESYLLKETESLLGFCLLSFVPSFSPMKAKFSFSRYL